MTDKEKIIAEVKGVILAYDDETVKVELTEAVIANFPINLFTDPDMLKCGQPLKYQIIKDAAGIKSQRFLPYVDNNVSQDQKLIKDILKDI